MSVRTGSRVLGYSLLGYSGTEVLRNGLLDLFCYDLRDWSKRRASYVAGGKTGTGSIVRT